MAEIYDQFSEGLYGYAVRQLGNPDMAEECVAETFIRFLESLHSGRGPRDHLQAYLYRIAHNWISDVYRRGAPPPLELEPSLQASPDKGPASQTAERMEAERIRSALVELTDDQRQVVVLKYLEGWKAKDIAKTMKKSVGAVKALQHRGISALRKHLINDG